MPRPALPPRAGRRLFRLLATTGAALLGGCGIFTAPETCASINGPGLAVTVFERGTMNSLIRGSLITARVGDHVEVLDLRGEVGVGGTAVMAWERTGRYQVTVERTGYERWQRDGIAVERGKCGMETVYVRAELVRTP